MFILGSSSPIPTFPILPPFPLYFTMAPLKSLKVLEAKFRNSDGFLVNVVAGLQRRWEFNDWKTSSSPNGSARDWSWSQARSWTGDWNIGQLFMWTLIIFAGMIGGFLFIFLIFFACGGLDNRRLKRVEQKVAARKRKSEKQAQESSWKASPVTQSSSPPAVPTKSVARDSLTEKSMKSIDSVLVPRSSVTKAPRTKRIERVAPRNVSLSSGEGSSIDSILCQAPKAHVVAATEDLFNADSSSIPTFRLSINYDNLSLAGPSTASSTGSSEGSDSKEREI